MIFTVFLDPQISFVPPPPPKAKEGLEENFKPACNIAWDAVVRKGFCYCHFNILPIYSVFLIHYCFSFSFLRAPAPGCLYIKDTMDLWMISFNTLIYILYRMGEKIELSDDTPQDKLHLAYSAPPVEMLCVRSDQKERD